MRFALHIRVAWERLRYPERTFVWDGYGGLIEVTSRWRRWMAKR